MAHSSDFLSDSDIKTMSVREARLLVKILPVDYEEHDDLMTLRQLLSSFKNGLRDCHVQNNLTEVLKKDNNAQVELQNLYSDVFELLKFCRDETSIIDGMMVYDKNYHATLVANYDTLTMKNTCPILFAGETSSGKTTLVNELLGQNLLPTSVVHSTAIICRVRNGESKSFTAIKKTGTPRTHNLDGKNNKEILSELRKAITNQHGEFDEVEISWPLPLINGRVALVDSPGFGSITRMNEILYKYLSQAAAFIYVVNISNAGGIQDDRLVKVLDYLKPKDINVGATGKPSKLEKFLDYVFLEDPKDSAASELSMNSEHRANPKGGTKQSQEKSPQAHLDPKRAMFILYKWDQVPRKEQSKIEDIVFNKLSWHWPGLKREQLYKLSLHTEWHVFKHFEQHSNDYIRFFEGIVHLIPEALKVTSMKNYIMLEKVLSNINEIVSIKLEAASYLPEHQKTRDEKIERLNNLSDKTQQVLQDLETRNDERKDDISRELIQYMTKCSTISAAASWQPKDLPGLVYNSENLRRRFHEAVTRRVTSMLKKWSEDTNMAQNMAQALTDDIRKELQNLDVEIRGSYAWKLDFELNSIDDDISGIVWSAIEINYDNTQVVLEIVIGILTFLGSFFGITHYEAYKERGLRALESITEKTMGSLTPEHISKFINAQFSGSEKVVKKALDDINKTVEGDKQVLEQVLDEVRKSEEIKEIFEPIKAMCDSIMAKLDKFRNTYL